MSALSRLRSFLAIHCLDIGAFFTFLHNGFINIFHFVRLRADLTNMASPVDSKAPSEADVCNKPRMVHLKTKEECRLGNELIQVWTVELSSKHAEGVLKYVNHSNCLFTSYLLTSGAE